MKKTIAIALTVLIAGGIATPAQAATPVKYKNCTAMNKALPGGYAKNASVQNFKTVSGKKVLAKSTQTPKVSAKGYALNKGLDRDKDGIACER